jgi:hypothetical protein
MLACICLSCSASNSGSKAASASDADQSSPSTSKGTEDEASADSGEGAGDGEEPSKKLPPGPSCLDQQGNIQECLSDTDCCKHFYCGIDPDGSTRQKVCLFGG